MKTQLAVSALALALSATASAATLNFSNGSGSYSSGGITATVTTTGGSLYYNSLQPSGGAIGVQGFLDFSGGITASESMTVTFNKAVTLNSLSFTNWTGGISTATITYAGGSKSLSNGLDLTTPIDTFALSGVNLTSFTITTGLTSDIFLHDLTATAAVPAPGAAWLLGSGLVSVAGLARRKKAQK